MIAGLDWEILVGINKTNKTWIDGHENDPSLLGIDNTIEVNAAENIAISTFGDSITVGLNATSNIGYANLLAERLGLTLNNLAVSARGSFSAVSAINSDVNIGNNSIRIVLGFWGLNDIRRGARTYISNSDPYRTNDKCINKIIASYRNLLVMKFRKSCVAAGSASVTRTGAHTLFAGQSVGGKYGDGVITIPGDTTTFVTAAGSWSYTFTGDNIVVGAFGSDGVGVTTWGTFQVEIDGSVVYIGAHTGWWDGVSDGANNNQRGPVPLVFFGLQNRQHTVVVRWISGTVVMDYFAVLNKPADVVGGALIGEIIKVRDYQKAGLNKASKEYSDLVSSHIRRVFYEFKRWGYPVALLRTDNFYDPDSGADPTDGVHPLDKGHYLLTRAWLTLISNVTTDQKTPY